MSDIARPIVDYADGRNKLTSQTFTEAITSSIAKGFVEEESPTTGFNQHMIFL
jgi:hypothetical protein